MFLFPHFNQNEIKQFWPTSNIHKIYTDKKVFPSLCYKCQCLFCTLKQWTMLDCVYFLELKVITSFDSPAQSVGLSETKGKCAEMESCWVATKAANKSPDSQAEWGSTAWSMFALLNLSILSPAPSKPANHSRALRQSCFPWSGFEIFLLEVQQFTKHLIVSLCHWQPGRTYCVVRFLRLHCLSNTSSEFLHPLDFEGWTD